MANTLNVNSLPEYINQNSDELFVKSVVGAKTLDYVEIMPNVKHKDALHYLDSTVELAEGACGWNPAGTDTFSDRYIEVKPISIQKEFCWLDMKEKYMNHQLNFEAGREVLPFEQKIAESNVEAIKKAVELMVWQGNAKVGVDGFLAQIASEDSAVKVTFAEGQTIVDKVDAVVAAIPAAALEKGVNVFMGLTDYRNYIVALNSTCCANRPIIDAASATIAYSGDSRVTIVPVLGLEGTNKIVASPADGLVYGTDIEGSESVYRLWYDEKERKFDFDVLFNGGTAVKLPDQVVLGA